MSQFSFTRPVVVLFHHPHASLNLIEASVLGCEEEGVPFEIRTLVGGAEELAKQAAETSTVFAGSGIDDAGSIAIHERRLGDRPPLIWLPNASTEQARSLGVAAGRLVRARPIPVIVEGDNRMAPEGLTTR